MPLAGVFPVLITQHLQVRAQKQQQILDRQINLVREYGSACGRLVAACDLLGVSKSVVDYTGSKYIDYKDMQRNFMDIQNATNDLYVAGVLANALFRTDINVALKSTVRGFQEGLRVAHDAKKGDLNSLARGESAFRAMPSYIESMAADCEKNMKILEDHVIKAIEK